MNLFDILGPVMVGPSSSHTAGAVRIGRMARRLLGEGTPVMARIALSGSFAATGQGHGTDRALVAGLLGMQPDDERIPHSFSVAESKGMGYTFSRVNLSGVLEEKTMAVKIRLKRMGAKKSPFYRVVVADERAPRDGKFIEEIGYYNPLTDPADIKINAEKATKWLNNGAQPTETVRTLLKKSEIIK